MVGMKATILIRVVAISLQAAMLFACDDTWTLEQRIQKPANCQFSSAMAMSGDGSTLVTSCSPNGFNVFDRSNEAWMQRGSTVISDEDNDTTAGVAISLDGTVVAQANQYFLNLLHWDGVSWSPLGNSIEIENPYPQISLSSDGRRVAWSAYANRDGPFLHIFDYDSETDTWVRDSNGVPSTKDVNDFDMTPDGLTIALATYWDGPEQVQVFRFDGSSWLPIGQTLTSVPLWSVSLSHDGNTLAVGDPSWTEENSDDEIGAAWVYALSDGVWTLVGDMIKGKRSICPKPFLFDFGICHACQDRTGASVRLSADGSVLAIGAQKESYVRAFQFANDSWNQLGGDIRTEGGVELSADGTVMVWGPSVDIDNAYIDHHKYHVYKLVCMEGEPGLELPTYPPANGMLCPFLQTASVVSYILACPISASALSIF